MINRNFNFCVYKGPQKLKTANINPYVFGANPLKFGDAKIFHFTVSLFNMCTQLTFTLNSRHALHSH